MRTGFSAREAKTFINRYLRTHAKTSKDRDALFRELRSMSGRIRWTPHLFETVTQQFAPELERGAGRAIFLAQDILKLASFEDAAALVCTEAAKDPACHPLLRGRTSFSYRDYAGDFWRDADSPALQRGIVAYLSRAVASRLRHKNQPG